MPIYQQLSDQEILNHKLHLLQTSQAVTLVGSFELNLADHSSIWTDGLFLLHDRPVAANNKILLEVWLEHVNVQDRQTVKKFFLREECDDLTELNYEIKTSTGHTKLLRAWCTRIKTEDGVYLKRGSIQDVSRQHKLETALMDANEELSIKAEITAHAEAISNSGSYEWNLSTGFMKYSNNLYRIFGCEPGSVEPSYEFFDKLVHPDDRAFIENELKNGFKSAQTITIDYRILLADSTLKYIYSRNQKFSNTKGDEIVIGSIRDVTEERVTLRELQKRTLLAESISDNNIDMIAAFDKDLKFTWWNKKCEEFFGLLRGEVIGKSPFELFPLISETEIGQALHAALQGKTTYLQNQQYAGKQGHLESVVTALEQDGEVFGVLIITHDLTDIRKVAHQLDEVNNSLKLKNQELEKSNNELESFSYIASHDLQEPLRKIRTFSERLLEKEWDTLSANGRDYLRRMDNASLRMQRLIEDLLAFSRTTTFTKSFQHQDLNLLLKEVQLNLKDIIEETGATITSEHLPVANIINFQFQQMLENLLINALKYRKETVAPEIIISCNEVEAATVPFETEHRNHSFYVISIKDNGIGFDQQYAEKIFEIFQRLHGKHEYSGTGIGLAICKKTMENHYGYISAEGVQGEGAVFHIYLPKDLPA